MKRWQFWLGIGISLIFLYFVFRDMELGQVAAAMRTAEYFWLLPGIAVYFIGVFVRSWRWHHLLRPLKKISAAAMFPIVTIGYMGNNIWPARAGEVLRAVILRDRHGVPVSASLATIIAERIFDGVVMLGFVFLNLGELARIGGGNSGFVGSIQQVAVIGSIFFLGALIVFLLAAFFPHTANRWGSKLVNGIVPARWRGSACAILTKFIDGLESLRTPGDVAMIFFTTVLIWLLETAKYWFVMHAFPFEVSFFALMLMNGIVNLTTTLPSAPGYVGTFEGPGVALLVAYGVNAEIALGYTLVLHAALWFPITLLGAYYYLRQPLRWGRDVQRVDVAAEG